MYSDHLKKALACVAPADSAYLKSVSGVDDAIYRRARNGWPIPVSLHLRLCAAVGIDPIKGGAPVAPAIVGNFHPKSFAVALRMKRLAEKWSLRKAEIETGVSYSALRRIEKGEPTSAQNVLNICDVLGRNPFDFVSREKQVAQNVAAGSPETVTA